MKRVATILDRAIYWVGLHFEKRKSTISGKENEKERCSSSFGKLSCKLRRLNFTTNEDIESFLELSFVDKKMNWTEKMAKSNQTKWSDISSDKVYVSREKFAFLVCTRKRKKERKKIRQSSNSLEREQFTRHDIYFVRVWTCTGT